jgi:hypothetical protein
MEEERHLPKLVDPVVSNLVDSPQPCKKKLIFCLGRSSARSGAVTSQVGAER